MRRACLLFASVLLCLSATNGWSQTGEMMRLYGRGVHDFFAHRYTEAQEQFDAAVKMGSVDPRVYYYRGLIHANGGEEEAAKTDFRTGGKLEFGRGRVYPVNRSLERVQGHQRIILEKYRREARLKAATRAKQRWVARYGTRFDAQVADLQRQATGNSSVRSLVAPQTTEPPILPVEDVKETELPILPEEEVVITTNSDTSDTEDAPPALPAAETAGTPEVAAPSFTFPADEEATTTLADEEPLPAIPADGVDPTTTEPPDTDTIFAEEDPLAVAGDEADDIFASPLEDTITAPEEAAEDPFAAVEEETVEVDASGGDISVEPVDPFGDDIIVDEPFDDDSVPTDEPPSLEELPLASDSSTVAEPTNAAEPIDTTDLPQIPLSTFGSIFSHTIKSLAPKIPAIPGVIGGTSDNDDFFDDSDDPFGEESFDDIFNADPNDSDSAIESPFGTPDADGGAIDADDSFSVDGEPSDEELNELDLGNEGVETNPSSDDSIEDPFSENPFEEN